MLRLETRSVFLLLVGIALAIGGHLALKGLVAYFELPGHALITLPHWVRVLYSLSQPLLDTLVQLVPAFVVGWWARQSGFILGALVGFVSSLAIVAWRYVPHLDSSLYVYLLFVWALPAAVSASVAGAAGQFARSGRPLTIHSSGRRSGAA